MPNTFYLLFFSVFILGFIEQKLTISWSKIYYRTGLKIYNNNFRYRYSISSDQLIETITASLEQPIVFKELESGFIAFYAKRKSKLSFKSSKNKIDSRILHGSIVIDPVQRNVSVIGRMNWASPASFVVILFLFMNNEAVFENIPLGFLVFMVAVSFSGLVWGLIHQSRRYDYITNTLKEILKAEPEIN